MSPIFRLHPLPPRICPSPPQPMTRGERGVSGGEARESEDERGGVQSDNRTRGAPLGLSLVAALR